MGYGVYELGDGRFGGYMVPAYCDHPDCNEEIHRGVGYVCGGAPDGGEYGCGLHFCEEHLSYAEIDDEVYQLCECCHHNSQHDDLSEWLANFEPKPEHPELIEWQLTDPSWADWREQQGLSRHLDMPFDESAPWYKYHEIERKELQYEEQKVAWEYNSFRGLWYFCHGFKESTVNGGRLTPLPSNPDYEFYMQFKNAPKEEKGQTREIPEEAPAAILVTV